MILSYTRDVIEEEGPGHEGLQYCGFLAIFLNFRYLVGILLRIAVWPFFFATPL